MATLLPDVRTSDLHSENGDPQGAVSLNLLSINGALAQLGEHLLCKQGVVGSIPTGSTTKRDTLGL